MLVSGTPMERERWLRIERLYHAALEKEPEIRVTFLKEACTDEDILREVETLLEYDRASDTVFDSPAWERRLHPGQRFGPYEILQHLGKGGMGEVWKARDTRLDRCVAIKLSDARFSDRLQVEAHAVAALNHPHICQIYDVGPDYLAMEFVEGRALRGPMPVHQAVRLAAQLAEALEAAHRKGIVHRDLKPENILLAKSGLKVLDFGLAKMKVPVRLNGDVSPTRPLTQEGALVGTVQYMAPEQVQGKPADARSDIFSFGCVLYEMLTGKRAFEGANIADRIAAVLDRPAPSISEIAPAGLDRVLRKCLEKDPDERWQNAGDLGAAIGLAAATREPIQMPSRRAWIAGAVGAAVGLTGAGAIARLRPRSNDESLTLDIGAPSGTRLGMTGHRNFSISPDGRTVAHTVWSAGKATLWVRPLDGIPRMVAEAANETSPFWSPDSKSIAFYRTGMLLRFDLAGGTPWILCKDLGDWDGGGTWTPDGRILFGTRNGLLHLPASGGNAKLLTVTDRSRGERSHSHPQALPHGRFLFSVRSDPSEKSAIVGASLANPAERIHVVTTDGGALYAATGEGKSYLLWQSEETLVGRELDTDSLKLRGETRTVVGPIRSGWLGNLLASASAKGSLLCARSVSNMSRLEWFNRDGKSLGRVGETAQYATMRLSPDGRRVAVSRFQPNRPCEIWIMETAGGTATAFSLAPSALPVWSQDGRTLLYEVGTPQNLFRQDLLRRAAPERLTTSQSVQLPNDWSRDGRFILYQETSPPGDNGNDLMVLELGADGKPIRSRPWLNSKSSEMDGRFSPELHPRWVTYYSRETGRLEVYIDSFPERRAKVQISTDGGRFPQWRGDGRELFFQSLDFKLMSVDVKLGRNSVQTSAPRELFPLPMAHNNLPPYEAAADGQRFLVRTAEHDTELLSLVTNWPALLRKHPG